MEIIKNFGVDPLLLLAQVVNFLVLVYLLKRFFLKKIIVFLESREKKIKDGLEAAQKGEELLEKAKISQKEILSKAHGEAKLFLQEAQKENLELAQKIQEGARKEAEKITKEARELAQEEAAKIQKELARETTRVAVGLVEKVLRDFLTVTDHKKILTHLSKNLERPS